MIADVAVHDSSSLEWGLEYPVQAQPDRVRSTISLRGSQLPGWIGGVVARIQELAAVPTVAAGGSRPLNPEDVRDALQLLVRVMRDDTIVPWIGRLSGGGVQLTWRRGDVEVEAVLDRRGGERAMIVVVGENEWDAPVDEADSLFATVADRLHVEYVTAA